MPGVGWTKTGFAADVGEEVAAGEEEAGAGAGAGAEAGLVLLEETELEAPVRCFF